MRLVVALVGCAVFGSAGGAIGAANAGWTDFAQDANRVFPLLGVGSALVVTAFWGSRFSRDVGERWSGRVVLVLLVMAPLLYVVSWLIEFAIFGTLALALGLAVLAVVMAVRRLAAPVDRVLVAVSAVLSFAWNTETASALLLVLVATLWAALSLRLLPR